MIHSIESSRKSFFQTTKNFVKQPFGFRFLVLQPAIKTLGWVDLIKGLSKTGVAVKKGLQQTNHLVKLLELPTRLHRYESTLLQLKEDFFSRSIRRIGDSSSNTYVQTVNLMGLFANTTKVFSERKLISLTVSQLKMMRGISFATDIGLIITGFKGMYRQIQILHSKEIFPCERNLALIHLANRVSIATIGILSTAYTFGFIVASWVFLTFSTAIVAFVLFGHFYEELIVIPKRKMLAQ